MSGINRSKPEQNRYTFVSAMHWLGDNGFNIYASAKLLESVPKTLVGALLRLENGEQPSTAKLAGKVRRVLADEDVPMLDGPLPVLARNALAALKVVNKRPGYGHLYTGESKATLTAAPVSLPNKAQPARQPDKPSTGVVQTTVTTTTSSSISNTLDLLMGREALLSNAVSVFKALAASELPQTLIACHDELAVTRTAIEAIKKLVK